MVFSDSSETRAIYDNVEKIWYGQTRRMCFACWITKATNTHSEYVMFSFSFTQKNVHVRSLIIMFIRKLSILL